MYSVTLSIPLVGTWLASLLFGGEFPGPDIIERLYVIHILLVPAAIAVLLTAHLAILVRAEAHAVLGARPARTTWWASVCGPYAAKALGLFFLTSAVLAFLGGVFQINPIWIYGPFDPAQVSAASQPDWYMGWLDGALRIMPGWAPGGGFEVPNPFFPGVLLAGLTFALLYAAFLEARVTGDHDEHHLLDRPRQRPVRTALGAADHLLRDLLPGAPPTSWPPPSACRSTPSCGTFRCWCWRCRRWWAGWSGCAASCRPATACRRHAGDGPRDPGAAAPQTTGADGGRIRNGRCLTSRYS